MLPAMNILFLCTGNSCRSQMAEGWTRHLGGPSINAQSAGIEAHGKNPRAIAVMQEAGIDISQQASTRVTAAMLESADLIVTVCGHADEHCPALPPGKNKIHWPLEDPARASGSESEIMQVFRASRDDIKQRVQELLDSLPASGPTSTAQHESV
jgi:arsenate reductase